MYLLRRVCRSAACRPPPPPLCGAPYQPPPAAPPSAHPQQEAAAAGGALHILNGNHETMSVAGQFRYATPEALHSFRAWLHDHLLEGGLLQRCGCGGGGEELRRMQRKWERHNDGRAARKAALEPGGPLTMRFLVHQPVVLQVGSSVFVHGGLLPEHVEHGMDRMNSETQVGWAGGLMAVVLALLCLPPLCCVHAATCVVPLPPQNGAAVRYPHRSGWQTDPQAPSHSSCGAGKCATTRFSGLGFILTAVQTAEQKPARLRCAAAWRQTCKPAAELLAAGTHTHTRPSAAPALPAPALASGSVWAVA